MSTPQRRALVLHVLLEECIEYLSLTGQQRTLALLGSTCKCLHERIEPVVHSEVIVRDLTSISLFLGLGSLPSLKDWTPEIKHELKVNKRRLYQRRSYVKKVTIAPLDLPPPYRGLDLHGRLIASEFNKFIRKMNRADCIFPNAETIICEPGIESEVHMGSRLTHARRRCFHLKDSVVMSHFYHEDGYRTMIKDWILRSAWIGGDANEICAHNTGHYMYLKSVQGSCDLIVGPEMGLKILRSLRRLDEPRNREIRTLTWSRIACPDGPGQPRITPYFNQDNPYSISFHVVGLSETQLVEFQKHLQFQSTDFLKLSVDVVPPLAHCPMCGNNTSSPEVYFPPIRFPPGYVQPRQAIGIECFRALIFQQHENGN